MPITEKELLTGFLSKTLNIDTTGVTSLYNDDGSLKDDALDTLLAKDVERVNKLKPDTKSIFQDGYKKAKSEVLTDFEKEFLEKTSYKSDKKGIDLILEYAANASKQNGEVNEDAIKKHPLYISTVERIQREKEEAITAEAKKLEQFQSELKRKETFNNVSKKALAYFNSLKPILSKDPVKAETQMRDFIEKLQGYEYDVQGDEIVVLKDGKVLEDKHGNRIKFDKVVKDEAEKRYDFHQADKRDSPANGKDDDDNGSKKAFSFDVPKTQAEYDSMISNPKIPVAERLAAKEAYMKQTKN